MEPTKRLSCERCQKRKVKCSRSQPCLNCANANTPCEYKGRDTRKTPVSHNYLRVLESRLAWFESFVKKLQVSSNAERDILLKEITFDDHLSVDDIDNQQSGQASTSSPVSNNVDSLKLGSSGALQYHGPTSIYVGEEPDVSTSGNLLPQSPFKHEIWSNMRLARVMGIDEALIKACLPLFFLHQYPQFMFVYREAFLADYFDQIHGGKYWSLPLVYAICALGAPHSEEPHIRSKNHLFAKCAQEIIYTHELTRPHPTTVQALLCLAFHELGQGNSSLGWLFSGMAFRMGQDIGFNQDPSRWVTQDRSIVTPMDIEIRRRIYWGCYIADKFVSLYLGRSFYLIDSDAAVQPSYPLPDFPDDYPWFGLGDLVQNDGSLDQDGKPQLCSAFRYFVTAGKVFQNILHDAFSPGKPQESVSAVMYRLGDLNMRLSRWYVDLPVHLQWSLGSSSSKGIGKHVASLHLFYHSIRLSLNRHFIRLHQVSSMDDQSFTICTESSEAVVGLVRQFRKQHGLRGSPLILVYALVMTITTILNMSDLVATDGQVSFLMNALQECAQVYKLAKETQSRLLNLISIRRKISVKWNNDRMRLEHRTQINQPNLARHASAANAASGDSSITRVANSTLLGMTLQDSQIGEEVGSDDVDVNRISVNDATTTSLMDFDIEGDTVLNALESDTESFLHANHIPWSDEYGLTGDFSGWFSFGNV